MASAADLEDLLKCLVKLEDGCSDSHTKDNIRTLRFLIIAILPFLRHMLELHVELEDFDLPLKNLDSEVKKMIRDFRPSDLGSSFFSGDEDLELSSSSTKVLFWLLNLADLARKAGSVFLQVSRSINWKKAEILLKIIHSLLKKLEHLSVSRAAKFIPVRETKCVLEEVKFLRSFLRLIKNRCLESENANYHFNIVENLTMELSSALCFLASDEKQEYYVNAEIVLKHLLSMIKSLQLVIKDLYDQSWESLQLGDDDDTPAIDKHVLRFSDLLIEKLMNLSYRNSSGMLHVKVQMNILIDELSFLRRTVMDLLLQAPHEEMKPLITSTQALIIETGYFVYFSGDMKEDNEMHFSSDICNLLEDVDTVKRHADALCGNLISLSRKSHRPGTNVLEFTDFLIKTLEKLMNAKEAPSCPLNLKHQFETFYKEIVPIIKCFTEIQITELGDSQMQFFLKSLKDTVDLAHYVIDSFEAGQVLLWYQKLGLFVATKDVKSIQKDVKAAMEKIQIHASPQAICHLPVRGELVSEDKFQGNMEETSDKLVGFKDAEGEILDHLTRGSERLKTISIVGMPGIGKSTLAHSVYKHPSTVGYFHLRAWCCISQVYEKEALLLEMLDQITHQINLIDEIGIGGGKDVVLKLYQALKGMKYLIVLDDIWDFKAWDDLKAAFPDDDNGSRILFTTRHRVVASGVHSYIFSLRLLTQKESCDLLWFKLFGSETCPQELLDISRHIARRCKGLPLAVVLIAGVLKSTERNKLSWEKVAKTFFGSNHGKQLHKLEHFNVLESSYSHLPNHLKPCFLYVGAYPGNTEIPVSKLIRLWISEGLLQQTMSAPRSLEQAAEDCLTELINRSLVMAARRSSIGGVKTCCVHDVLRDFCAKKLVEERSLTQENKVGGISIVHSVPEKHTRSLLYDQKSDRVIIVGNDQKWTYIPMSSWGTPLRARKVLLSDRVLPMDRPLLDREVLTDGAAIGTGNEICGQMDYHFVFNCKSLRVLELANVGVENSADAYDLVQIFELIHLTYLAIRVCTSEIPPQIINLRNLETFLLRGPIGEVVIPETLWSLESLNHVLNDHSFFSLQHYSPGFFDNLTQLDNLKSISNLHFSHGDDVERVLLFLRRLTEIKKLGCRFSNSWDDATGYNVFPVLGFLSKLESLKVFFSSKVLVPCEFSFPSNIKKLSLSNSRLPWGQLSVILKQLPNLEVLKLLNKAFEGRQWDMGDGGFPKLKFLKLDSLNIRVWNADAEQLPRLEQIVVLSCPELEEIPSSFGDISSLQRIEMKWCSSSAMDSVNQILQIQRDFSNDQLKVSLLASA